MNSLIFEQFLYKPIYFWIYEYYTDDVYGRTSSHTYTYTYTFTFTFTFTYTDIYIYIFVFVCVYVLLIHIYIYNIYSATCSHLSQPSTLQESGICLSEEQCQNFIDLPAAPGFPSMVVPPYKVVPQFVNANLVEKSNI